MVAQEHPEWAATSWTALGIWGVEYFVDDADTCVLSNGRASLAKSATAVTRHRNQSVHAATVVFTPDPYCRELMTVPPVMAFAMALRSLSAGQHRWNVPQGTGLSDEDLRAVQLIDAVSTTFGVDPQRWPDACHYLLSTRRLRRLVALCDQGAESPTETVMRLMAAQIQPGMVSQLVVLADGTVADPVHTKGALPGRIRNGQGRSRQGRVANGTAGRIVARLDLGHPELKLALQYDGAGHMTADRRDRDSKINAELANLGWHVVRITYGHLRDPNLFETTVRDAVSYCRRRMTR